MVDEVMAAPCALVNTFPHYEAFIVARAAFLQAYGAWLCSWPAERLCTIELMGTQAAIRQMHDDITGRVVLDALVEGGL